MTEEKAQYLVKKLKKNIKKEIFSIFEGIFHDCKDDKNYEYAVTCDLDYDEWKQISKACFYVYYGDYRKSSEYKFNSNDRGKEEYICNGESIKTSCYFEVEGRDDFLDSSQMASYTLARLMHYSKKYDKKLKKDKQ